MNEAGMLHDLIMCHIIGVDKLPDGFEVRFVNGDTLDCRRENLVLQRIGILQDSKGEPHEPEQAFVQSK
jgi:hypothetical protein